MDKETLDKAMEIKELTTVTAQGVRSFKIGLDGITKIEETAEQIGEYQWVYFYVVMKGENVYAKISKTCPVEIIYSN